MNYDGVLFILGVVVGAFGMRVWQQEQRRQMPLSRAL